MTMRKAVMILAVGLLACASLAGKFRETAELGTNGTAQSVDTVTGVKGWIEEIYIEVPGTTTGNVTITYQPVFSGMSAVTMYATNGLASDITVRPRVDITGTDGIAITGDEPTRFYLYGEAITITITNTASSTGGTWRVYGKYEND